MLPFVIYDSFGFFLFYFMGKNTGNILFIYDRQVTTSFSIVLFSSSAGSLCGNQYR